VVARSLPQRLCLESISALSFIGTRLQSGAKNFVLQN
jgi:hypothetical protein